MPIKVVVADTQQLIRFGLKFLLNQRDDIELVGEAANRDQLLSLMKNNQADVLVIDYLKEHYLSIQDIDFITKNHSKTKILVISSDNDRQRIFSVLEKGVNSFLTKECDQSEIIDAIKATAIGDKFFCKKVVEFLLERSLGKEPYDCSPTSLSAREIEIVKLVAEGKTAKEISEEINISTHTIYTHRKNIMRKLQLNSSSELVLFAVRHGIIDSAIADSN